ncbi:twin-arginine translocase TatA/TatE family subunit [Microbacterium sp. CIAB417]|uniref:Sec-independent protein translocase subunit TatA/TatB n=1 Tax=Microbacterium sp. CIAB417 TaxID=2860287 RepID=UPI001FAD1253|nr:twin-arginine translocase TatA/TatE family subunit [Microbacterium sp. CIAB417]
MFQNLTGWHALIVLAIVLLIFGAAKLPALARSVGQSVRILRSESTEPSVAAPAAAEGVDLAPAQRGTDDRLRTGSGS